ncbi:hypothetical protein ASPZODRAFT_155475 [Penicilliopsis zonata CBS 506.65]|uniref:Cytochrome P450 n=1 Tax=Penicilliopsis zonata CBS 506.65 TaxID=1073090 RepID=A0A1L9S4U3_9EURO|nr:hypothetical protein ASPZODRAFT_155475 [Penicilliopsis zonata CBS 506.65]OJJ42182.1 hypothetical protein ASPZODRAFT_155475 [Penicilliopsis zonata CBS 506.65]
MQLAPIVAIIRLIIGIYITTRKSTSSLPLPPGPKPLPIIGNLHQAPKSHSWRTYHEWSKRYGPIIHVNILGQPVIILSTSEAAHDLLAIRGATFSDRPYLFLATDLAMKGLSILFMNYNDQFRQHQRVQISVFNATSSAAYLPFQILESQQLMHDLLRAVASTIHTLLYGFRVKDSNDPMLRALVDLNTEFSEFVRVGAHIVDLFPVLNNLPGFLAPWQAKAENHFTTKCKLRNESFRRAVESDAWNISKHHFKQNTEGNSLGMPLDELVFEIGTTIDAALDATTDSLIWFVVACITQDRGFVVRARKELDAVVGRDRLPSPDDRPNLPYIAAIVEEIFRWRPAAPEAAPHANREATTYNGYIIPRGSIVVPNVWAISREEAVFGSDPDDFIPDRWLDEDGKTLKPFPPAVFGYGRRTCPGRYFARNTIWIVVARLLWSFDIKAGLSEETGESIPVDPEACTYGLIMRALPFKASFQPRGPWVRDVITRDGDTYSKDHAAMLNKVGGDFMKL